jgi:uncharacterized protein YgiB involved in biofilm formation
MKRTKSINLDRMRKSAVRLKLKPLVIGIAAFSLAGCGDSRKADIYSSVEHCNNDNPNSGAMCEKAYETALAKSAKEGPKYLTKYDCTADFGRQNCVPYQSSNGASLFMPAVAAFALAQAVKGDKKEHQSSPLYTSSYYGSSFYNRWSTVDGRTLKKQYGTHTVNGDTFKTKPTVTKTMSRGGFGSTVAAKSSWGGSGSKGGWGG